jgi:hypothetical protein
MEFLLQLPFYTERSSCLFCAKKQCRPLPCRPATSHLKGAWRYLFPGESAHSFQVLLLFPLGLDGETGRKVAMSRSSGVSAHLESSSRADRHAMELADCLHQMLIKNILHKGRIIMKEAAKEVNRKEGI